MNKRTIMNSFSESESPIMETNLINNSEIRKLDFQVTCETTKEIFTNEDGSFSTQCNNCNYRNNIKNFLDWTNGQSKIKIAKCKKCNHSSVIKICMFVKHNLTENKFIPDIHYKIYSCDNTVAKSITHTCAVCGKQRNIKAIPQTEFTAMEEYVCNCFSINQVQIKSNELNLKPKRKTPTHSIVENKEKERRTMKELSSALSLKFNNRFATLPVESHPSQDDIDHEPLSRSQSETSLRAHSPRARSQSLKRSNPYDQTGGGKNKRATRRLTPKNSVENETPQMPAVEMESRMSKHVPPILITDPHYKFRDNKDPKKITSDQLVADLTKLLDKYHGTIRRNPRSKNIMITTNDYTSRSNIIEDIKQFKPDLVFIAPKPKGLQIKTTKVVIRNPTLDYDQEKQLDEMERCIGIRPINIKRITFDVQLCIFDGNFSFKEIAERMKNTREHFFHAPRLVPEKYKVSADRVLQCKNCFRFNHATSACHAPKKSPTTQIQNKQGINVKVCSNCLDVQPEQHTATQRKCPLFQKAMERQRKMTEEKEKSKRDKNKNTQPGVSYAEAASGLQFHKEAVISEEKVSQIDMLKKVLMQCFEQFFEKLTNVL